MEDRADSKDLTCGMIFEISAWVGHYHELDGIHVKFLNRSELKNIGFSYVVLLIVSNLILLSVNK